MAVVEENDSCHRLFFVEVDIDFRNRYVTLKE